jgi:hypothetical protein
MPLLPDRFGSFILSTPLRPTTALSLGSSVVHALQWADGSRRLPLGVVPVQTQTSRRRSPFSVTKIPSCGPFLIRSSQSSAMRTPSGRTKGRPAVWRKSFGGAVHRVAQPRHEVRRIVVPGLLREDLTLRVGALDAADLAALVGDAAQEDEARLIPAAVIARDPVRRELAAAVVVAEVALLFVLDLAIIAPGPQLAVLHASAVKVLLLLAPLSHASLPIWSRPSPHFAVLHSIVQAPELLFSTRPRSHSSPGSSSPFPQPMRGASPVELAASVLVLVSLVDVLVSPVPVEPLGRRAPEWPSSRSWWGCWSVGGSPVPLVDELVARSTSPAGASPA